MTNEVQLHREGDQVTIQVGGSISTMNIGEWSKLISRPKKFNVFEFAQRGESPSVGIPHRDDGMVYYVSPSPLSELPSDSEPA